MSGSVLTIGLALKGFTCFCLCKTEQVIPQMWYEATEGKQTLRKTQKRKQLSLYKRFKKCYIEVGTF